MEKEAGPGDWAPLSSAPPRGLLGSTSGADNRARRALLGDSLASTGAPTVLLSISPTRALVPFRLAILACTRSRMALMSVESRLVGAVWCGSAESPVLRKRPKPTGRPR